MRISLAASTIVISFLTLTFLSCKSQEESSISPPVPESVIRPISYLALGDSYTIGEGVEDLMRWPNQLKVKLEENKYEVVRTDIIAQTGWRTDNLIDAIATSQLETYNLVSLLIGVNNQFQKKSFDDFTTEFDSLLNISISLAGGKERVFVLSIPDYGVTPFGSSNSQRIGEELDSYNAYMNRKCTEMLIPFIDITGISRQLGDSDGALAEDKLHPSGRQYGEWVEKALPIVLELVSK